MSSQVNRSPVRGYRRRKATLNLDLNTEPGIENRDQEGTSNQGTSPPLETVVQGQAEYSATIDVEELDDDVAFCSPTAFAEAKRKARRNQGVNEVVDVESDELFTILGPVNPKRRRGAGVTRPEIVFGDLYINLDSNNKSSRESSLKPVSLPPPPKEPTFSCPICMGPLVEETSTKCGHIFCKGCIRTAISAQTKCPTCRKKVVMKDLIRIFLPATTTS
ncbi:hypothetical protein MLD38_026297 [Melastoma candidum]|uniref:Uncharacterized protein n=1 Tax=Melastoma candidum TaxID=119954 RepID=A0ACB9NY52_9MYRT|nr:hypothetical protein MLD38_026297 [Melastoma candidum]